MNRIAATCVTHFFVVLGITCCSLLATAQKDDSISRDVEVIADPRPKLTDGFKPTINVSPYYRLYAGASYHIVQESTQKKPYAAKHTIGLNYSISETSFHPYYKAHFPQLIGQWDLSFLGGYDEIRRINFYGIGNETKREAEERLNQVHSHHQYAGVGIERAFARHHIDLSFFYNAIQLLDNVPNYISKNRSAMDTATYRWQYFLGPRITYSYTVLNDPILPTKGIDFTSALSYTSNTKRSTHSFARVASDVALYFPLPHSFSLATRTGLAHVSGSPDFYQLNTIGGSNSLRGYQRFRFYGNTAFYNQNELRWITRMEKGFLKGPIGLMALFDQGRVWQPSESSGVMHYGYGGGVIFSLLKKYVITAAYALSKEDGRINFRIKKILQ